MSEITENTPSQVHDLIEESISTTIEENIPQIEPQVEPQIEPNGEPNPEELSPSEPTSLEGLMFDGLPVQIEVPDDVRQLAESKGFEAEKLISELFQSETFEFSAETRTALDEAYGKTYVDFLLKGLKADMEGSVKGYKDSLAAKESAEKEAYDAALAIVGGEEGWAALEAFANSQGEEYINGLNGAMQSGNKWLQEVALKAALGQMDPAQPVVESSPAELTLIEGDSKVVADKSFCSASEYREAIQNGSYAKDPQRWDTMRRMGLSKGL